MADETPLARTVRSTLMPWSNSARQTAEFLSDCIGLNGDSLTFSEYDAAMRLLDEVERQVSHAKLAVDAMHRP